MSSIGVNGIVGQSESFHEREDLCGLRRKLDSNSLKVKLRGDVVEVCRIECLEKLNEEFNR